MQCHIASVACGCNKAWSQEELAIAAGLNLRTIQEWTVPGTETGKSSSTPRFAATFAAPPADSLYWGFSRFPCPAPLNIAQCVGYHGGAASVTDCTSILTVRFFLLAMPIAILPSGGSLVHIGANSTRPRGTSFAINASRTSSARR